MSDRSGAYLFSRIFKLVDEHVTDEKERKKLAREFWKETRDYDFSYYDLDCDDVLIRLGLAKKGVNPRYPEDGEVTLYDRGGGEFRA